MLLLQTDLEIQALKDNLKKAENKLTRKNDRGKDKDSKVRFNII